MCRLFVACLSRGVVVPFYGLKNEAYTPVACLFRSAVVWFRDLKNEAYYTWSLACLSSGLLVPF